MLKANLKFLIKKELSRQRKTNELNLTSNLIFLKSFISQLFVKQYLTKLNLPDHCRYYLYHCLQYLLFRKGIKLQVQNLLRGKKRLGIFLSTNIKYRLPQIILFQNIIVFRNLKIDMGNSSSKGSETDANLQGWQIKEKNSNFNIWRNTGNPKLELEEYALYFNDEKQFLKDKRQYERRKNSSNLVSSHHFMQEKQEEFCSSVYKGNIFLERIPVRLSNVSDLPSPDVLHVNKQALEGFGALSQEVGFFGITEEHIGFNSEGVAKVWMNKDFEKNFPSQNVCKEEEMVVSILRIIDQNTDRISLNRGPSLFEFLYSNPSQPFDGNQRIGFNEALKGLQQFAGRFNRGQIPPFMNCVRKVGTQQLMRQYVMNQNRIERNSINNSSVPSSQTNLVNPIGRTQNRQPTILSTLGPLQSNRSEVNKQNITFVPILNGLSSPFNQGNIKIQSQRQIVSSTNIPAPKSQDRNIVWHNKKIQGFPTIQQPVHSQFRPSLPNQIIRSEIHRVKSPALVPINRSGIQMQIRQSSFGSVHAYNQSDRNVQTVQSVQKTQNVQVQSIQNTKQNTEQTTINGQRTPSQTYNSQAVQQKKIESLLNHKSIVATSQVIPNNGRLDSDRLKLGFNNIVTQERNTDYFGKINTNNSPFQRRESPTNYSQVPQISDLSSIAKQFSQKNKNYDQSQKPFSEIRGESINNSTVNFYNSYMNKEDDSQTEWQDYTQAKKEGDQVLTQHNYQQKYSVEYSSGTKLQGGTSGSKNYKDGTSSEQFWNQLKNFRKLDLQGSQRTAAFGSIREQVPLYSYNPSNKKTDYTPYEPTYQTKIISYGANQSEPISSYKRSYQYQQSYNPRTIQNTYSYGNQESVKVSSQSNYGIDNRSTAYQFTSPPKNLEDMSHKVSQSPEPIRVFQAQSFGVNNQKGRSLEENLQMKYSMANQEEEYQVDWDPQILADLQNIQA